MDYLIRAEELKDEITAHRRFFHKNAETGLDMPMAVKYVTDQLEKYGWLQKEDYEIYDSEEDDTCVDYGKLYETRYPILRKAFHNSKISNSEDFQRFRIASSAPL